MIQITSKGKRWNDKGWNYIHICICKNQLFVGAIFNLNDEIHIKRKGNKIMLIVLKFASHSTSANEIW